MGNEAGLTRLAGFAVVFRNRMRARCAARDLVTAVTLSGIVICASYLHTTGIGTISHGNWLQENGGDFMMRWAIEATSVTAALAAFLACILGAAAMPSAGEFESSAELAADAPETCRYLCRQAVGGNLDSCDDRILVCGILALRKPGCRSVRNCAAVWRRVWSACNDTAFCALFVSRRVSVRRPAAARQQSGGWLLRGAGDRNAMRIGYMAD